MILRELVTRFSFETDSKGIKQFNSHLAGMRSSIGKFAALLGVGLGTKEILDLSGVAGQAEFNLRRFAGTDFNRLRQGFNQTRRELNLLKAGAGETAKTLEFDTSATNFFRVFGQGQKQLRDFREVWAFAARQSALTGKNAQDIAETFQQGLLSGDFSPLLDLPGFDQFRKNMLQFQDKTLDPNEPGGQIALQRRINTALKFIRDARKEQDVSIRQVPDELLQSRAAAQSLRETLANMGRDIRDLLVPALKKLNEVLVNINQRKEDGFLLGSTKEALSNLSPTKNNRIEESDSFTGLFFGNNAEERKEAADSWKTLPNDLRRILFGRTQAPLAFDGIPRERGGNLLTPDGRVITQPEQDASTRREQDRQRFVGGTINQTINMNIKSTDPNEVGREVKRVLDRTMEDAQRNLIKLEDD